MTLHGAEHLGEGTTRFRVWAPRAETVALLLGDGREVALRDVGDGYHAADIDRAGPGTRYSYLLDRAGPYPDPASRSQPDGVHGPSEVVETRFPTPAPPHAAGPAWRGIAVAAQVVCELHVGTFSAAGTFAGVVAGLDHLAEAGYTTIECMPVGEFPGTRNWGYDGVFPFAVQSSYGGPAGLAALVDAAHARGLAVVVDVVYNHLGPEGAVHDSFGPYLTDRYVTPWGRAVNVDGPGSDAVRAYFVEHACYLVGNLGVDGLRLDAVHEIVDTSAVPFIAELTETVHCLGRALGRTVSLTAESPANDPRLTTPVAAGGLGCDASWDDDFHHALRSTLTAERDRWFADFHGITDLATATTRGWVLTGRTSVTFGRRHGAPLPKDFDGGRLTAFAQNHDQIGNAGFGQRLAATLPLDAQFPTTTSVLLSPFVPLRFMGEEYGETAPFFFFTSHSDTELVEAVRQGRAAEVGENGGGPTPDPQDAGTFAASRPDRSIARDGIHHELLAWQREMLEIRREEPAFGSLEPGLAISRADPATATLVVVRHAAPGLDAPAVATLCRFSPDRAEVHLEALSGRRWRVRAAHGCGALAAGDILSLDTGTDLGAGGPGGGDAAGGAWLACDGYAVLVLVADRRADHRVENAS